MEPQETAMADGHTDHQARIARLDAMIAHATSLPSWPTMAAQIEHLTQTIVLLTTRVAVLEQECDALRQRELLRLWDTTSPVDNGREA